MEYYFKPNWLCVDAGQPFQDVWVLISVVFIEDEGEGESDDLSKGNISNGKVATSDEGGFTKLFINNLECVNCCSEGLFKGLVINWDITKDLNG